MSPADLRRAVMFIEAAESASAALRAARGLGVLDRLEAAPCSVEELAGHCGIGRRGADALLTALVALGLVETAGDGWFEAGEDLRPLAAFPSRWDDIEEIIRTGKPATAFDSPRVAEQVYPQALALMATVAADDAEVVADRLGRPGLRVLDVGAGAAPWSRALARRDRACRCTALDLPGVLEVTRRLVIEAGLGPQFDLTAGDVHMTDLPGAAFDLIVVANLCHLFDEATNRALLGRLRTALAPGGQVAVVDVAPAGELRDDRWAALYALGLFARTTAGRPYPATTYRRWLEEAGYDRVSVAPLPSGTLGLITGHQVDGPG